MNLPKLRGGRLLVTLGITVLTISCRTGWTADAQLRRWPRIIGRLAPDVWSAARRSRWRIATLGHGCDNAAAGQTDTRDTSMLCRKSPKETASCPTYVPRLIRMAPRLASHGTHQRTSTSLSVANATPVRAISHVDSCACYRYAVMTRTKTPGG